MKFNFMLQYRLLIKYIIKIMNYLNVIIVLFIKLENILFFKFVFLHLYIFIYNLL